VTTSLAPDAATAALLVAANRAMVFGTVSRWLLHDLRSPAQALSLVLDLLDQGDPAYEPTVRQTLDDASRRLRSLLELLDRTLRLAPPALAPGPLALHEIVDHLADLQRCSRTAVVLDTAAVRAAGLPAVRGVEDHLVHALLNLLMNANEALRERRGGAVRITPALAPDGRTVALAIEDDGPGVPPAIQAQLFTPFVTTKRASGTAGLGLAVARQLLQAVDGNVRYAPGAKGTPGARFVVELRVWER
jgi:signal transduction histidine kinase